MYLQMYSAAEKPEVQFLFEANSLEQANTLKSQWANHHGFNRFDVSCYIATPKEVETMKIHNDWLR
jgi:hypothetical protein